MFKTCNPLDDFDEKKVEEEILFTPASVRLMLIVMMVLMVTLLMVMLLIMMINKANGQSSYKMPALFHPRAHLNRAKNAEGVTVEACPEEKPEEKPATDGASSVLAGLLLLPLLVVHHL